MVLGNEKIRKINSESSATEKKPLKGRGSKKKNL